MQPVHRHVGRGNGYTGALIAAAPGTQKGAQRQAPRRAGEKLASRGRHAGWPRGVEICVENFVEIFGAQSTILFAFSHAKKSTEKSTEKCTRHVAKIHGKNRPKIHRKIHPKSRIIAQDQNMPNNSANRLLTGYGNCAQRVRHKKSNHPPVGLIEHGRGEREHARCF